jgi:cyclopropane fatty-acyl-phospholipid synthase-like methyltransferase
VANKPACRDSPVVVYAIVTTIALTGLVWYYVRAWKSESNLKRRTLNSHLDKVAGYYERMTESYLRYGGQTLGWHFGLWGDPPGTFEDALVNSNRILTEGCDLLPGQLVLDAGCGVGGLAFYLAQTFEVNVIGITICRRHVDMATQFAMERNLSHQVEFRLLDFMNLDFEDESFDFVFNQESFCYALSKKDFLKRVYRVLRPGGRWQAVDGFSSDKPLTDEQEEYHRTIQHGWKIAPLPSVQDIQSVLSDIGFEDIRVRDLSEMAYPSAFIAIRNSVVNKEKIDVAISSLSSEEAVILMEHNSAGAAISYGLLEGAFTYQLVGGTKKEDVRKDVQ